ncbi:hypothetical protein ACP4OV_021855 [Aristida adscensionis]
MDGAKTLTPSAAAAAAAADAKAAAPETLAAGELVWARPRSRVRRWWPARLLAAGAAADVSYLGDPAAAPTAPPAQVRRLADPDADAMARGSGARAFLAAVGDAHARAVAALRAGLSCACVPPPDAADAVAGVANLAPAEFLAALLGAALDVRSAGFVDRARLKSWARAFGEGWGPDGAGHYPRRPLKELEDKIDLDVLVGEDRDADDVLTDEEHTALGTPDEAPTKKKRSALKADLDAEGDEVKNGTASGLGTSGKRERKMSKYLSPPYINLATIVVPRKAVDSPKVLAPDAAAEDDGKVSLDSIAAEEVLLVVSDLAKDVRHWSCYLKDAVGFLGLFRLFRRSALSEVADYGSDMALEKRQAGTDIAVDSPSVAHAVLKQGTKRGRKRDDAGSGTSSKRKKRDKPSPATHVHGVPVTPAIPIRQVKAEDMRSQMKGPCDSRSMGAGAQDEKTKPSLFECDVSVAAPATTDQVQEQVQANDESLVRALVGNILSDQTAKENDEDKPKAAKSETNVHTSIADVPVLHAEEMEAQSNIPLDESVSTGADVPMRSVQTEAMEAESKIPLDESVGIVVSDVPANGVSKEAMKLEADTCIDESVQSVVADVPDGSVSKEATEAGVCKDENASSVVADMPMHEDVAQPIDENKEQVSVEACTVHQSYASLEAMVPETLQEQNTNGTDVVAAHNAFKYECQNNEQANQKVKFTAAAAANDSSGEGANTCPAAPNSTHKKKPKKAAWFENPAAIDLQITPGVMLPIREELHTAFGKYGFLIESQTEIRRETRIARVVFGKRIEAEAACRNAEMLGQFGPPFAKIVRLQVLPPIKLSNPPPPLKPASKPEDIKENLETMISYLTQKKAKSPNGLPRASEDQLRQMYDLLAKVNASLSESATSTPP